MSILVYRNLIQPVFLSSKTTNLLLVPSNDLMLEKNNRTGVGDDTRNAKKCKDITGKLVEHRERFFPPGDPCKQCTCDNGEPQICYSVYCQLPPCKDFRVLTDRCCDFICSHSTNISDPFDYPAPPQLPPSHALGLRLASTITSFLILALLLFMIHRLRQRRLLLMIRRLQNRRLETTVNDSGCYPVYDRAAFGYLDPPPPYAFWKPQENNLPSTPEAPPPYEESVFNSRGFNNNSGVNRLSMIPEEPSSLQRGIERTTTTTGTSPIRSTSNISFPELVITDALEVGANLTNQNPNPRNHESSCSSCRSTHSSCSTVSSPGNTSSELSISEDNCNIETRKL